MLLKWHKKGGKDVSSGLIHKSTTRNKSNPEAPKALHFLIASTRNECNARGGDQAKERNYSREAFEFLHSQFSKSEWTKSTKYYY